MDKDQQYREISLYEAAARDNSLFTTFTNDWGLYIRPYYHMDKLRFCFVQKGTAGEGKSFEIRMDCVKFGAPCFKIWANDILSPTRRFEAILREEKGEKYPKEYKFITGANGDKSIGIANSSNGNGYIINGVGKTKSGEKVYANIPISFGALQLLAQEFVRTYEARTRKLDEIREEAAEEERRRWGIQNESSQASHADEATQSENNVEQPAEAKSDIRKADITLKGMPVNLKNGFFSFETSRGTLRVSYEDMKKYENEWNSIAALLTANGNCSSAVLIDGDLIVGFPKSEAE